MAAMDDPIASEQFRAVADLAGLSSGFEALFQAAPSPFLVVIPPDYTIIAVNDAYLRATMTERAAILGRVLFEVFPDDPNDPSADGTRKLRASLERVVATRRLDQMSTTRYPIPRPAALGGGFDERWWAPRNAPVVGPGGEVACIIHHVEDVTDRVRAEVARRESEEKYRVLFDSIDEAFCTIEVAFDEHERAVDYQFLLVNPSFERQTGIANAPGRWMREIAPRHEQHWFETYGRVALTGEPVRFINEAAQLGRWYDGFAFRVDDPRLRHVGIIFNDITERLRGENALRESEERLRGAVEERGELLKELHHRVKNNLQVITSLLEMQARQTADSQVLSSLSDARNRITAIAAIHELLYQTGSFSEVDLAAYARRLLRHVVSLHEGKAHIDAAVTGEGIAIDLARAVPFGLLLNELVTNAYKHAFPSGTVGTLRVAFLQEDDQIHVHVQDTGIGLPNGFDERPTTTLGLQLVSMLTKQLGGTVTFESAGGTTVEVRLPVRAKIG